MECWTVDTINKNKGKQKQKVKLNKILNKNKGKRNKKTVINPSIEMNYYTFRIKSGMLDCGHENEFKIF